ncbi:MAG: hypothetical protein AMXMBFR83_29100 [Phycisphaerae bacterium]
MEDHDPKPHAERKLKQKRCDLIVLNGPDNVGGDRAVVELYAPSAGWSGPFRGTKRQIARRLIREIERMWKPASDPGSRLRPGSKRAS